MGVQTIEGLITEGHRLTVTWSVNSQGKPAWPVDVIETWVSFALDIEVIRKDSNARTGEWVARYTNIHRGEQKPSLFQVPRAYTIKDVQ